MDVGHLRTTLELDDRGFKLSVRDAHRLLQQLERRFDETGRAVNRIEGHMGSVTTKFRHFVMTLGMARFALMDIYDVFLRLPTATLKTAGELERLTKLMEGLSNASTQAGRAAEAAGNMKFLFDMAKNAPFEVKALSDAFVKLKSSGVDPTTGSMQALIDSVAKFGGDSSTLHRASIAIQQMSGKGVISMEELRQQLGEAIPNAIQMMARGLNMSMSELVDKISKGTVASKDALNRMFTMMTIENRGAAAAMMETWTGTISRLSTEWTLFQDAVGKSGFSQAVKDVLKEIIGLFQGGQGQSLARDIGAALAELVKFTAEVVRGFVQMWDVIKMVGAVWASYFVASRIANTFGSMRNGIMGTVDAWNRKNVALQAYMRDYRAASIEEARREVARVAEAQKADLAILANKKTHLAALKAEHAATMRDIAIQSSLYTRAPGSAGAIGGMLDLNGRVADASAVAHNNTIIAGMNAKAAALQRSMQLEQEAIKHTTVMNAATRDLAREKLAAARAIEKVGLASQVTAGALGASRFIWAALGGWVGAITLALAFGVPAWLNWANRAEESIKRVRQAINSGMSDEETVNTQKSLIAEQESKIARLHGVIENIRQTAGPGSEAAFRDIAQTEQQIQDEEAKLLAMRVVLAQAQKQAIENGGREAAQAVIRAWEMEQRERDRVARDRAEGARGEIIKRQEGVKDASKIAEIEREANKAFVKIMADSQREEVKVLETLRTQQVAENKKLEKEGAAADKARLVRGQAMVEWLNKQLDVRRRFEADIAHLTDPAELLAKGAGKMHPVQTPIEQLLARREAEVARMNMRMGNIKAGVEGMMGLKSEIDAQVDAMNEQGEFKFRIKDTEHNASAEQVARLKGLMFEQELQKKALEMYSQMRRLRAGGDPETEDGLDFLGGSFDAAMGDKTRAVERMLSALKRDLPGVEEQVKKMGFTFDEFAQKNRFQAAIQDMVNFLRPLREQTDRIGAELEETDDARRTRQFEAEQSHQQRLFATRLSAMVTSGAAEKDILSAMEIFHANSAARLAKFARDMETPMQKLNRDWQDLAKQMGEAVVRAANQSTEAIVEFVRTGKFSFSSLVESILIDLTRIAVQKTITGPLAAAISGVIPDLFRTGGGGIAGAQGITAGDGINFANGGIMTRFGEASLKRYAGGGIANSPQLALFGEGTRPEAYVPLPDGRSIPVTMAGAMPSVQLNVFNQTGQPVDAAQGQPRMDGGKMVLDVVLTAANQPGPFRDAMRNAMK